MPILTKVFHSRIIALFAPEHPTSLSALDYCHLLYTPAKDLIHGVHSFVDAMYEQCASRVYSTAFFPFVVPVRTPIAYCCALHISVASTTSVGFLELKVQRRYESLMTRFTLIRGDFDDSKPGLSHEKSQYWSVNACDACTKAALFIRHVGLQQQHKKSMIVVAKGKALCHFLLSNHVDTQQRHVVTSITPA
jgi:hypothetical protein